MLIKCTIQHTTVARPQFQAARTGRNRSVTAVCKGLSTLVSETVDFVSVSGNFVPETGDFVSGNKISGFGLSETDADRP